MKSIARIALLVLIAVGLSACGDDAELPETVVQAAVEDGRFVTLAGALGATGLDETLSGPGPWTVFAPTDAAFALLPEGLVGSLSEEALTIVLLYHVVGREVLAEEVVTLESAPTAEGRDLPIQIDGETVVLDKRVQITQTDILAENGVIHVIDAVLLPGAFPGTVVDMLVASPRFSTLTGAVVAEGLAGAVATSDGITVFAPTNAAFDLLPGTLVADLAAGGSLDDVLLYHVLPVEVDSAAAVAADGAEVATLAADGEGLFAVAVNLDGDGDLYLDERSRVSAVDIITDNGTVHVLDSVLVPGGNFPGTMVEALMAYPRFTSLVAAVVGEGLAGAVTGNITVFAPTNDAFASADLMGNTLASVLAYHLLPTEIEADDLETTETTVQGSDINVVIGADVVLNSTTTVLYEDIEASDGLIHVIDGVLVPPMAP